MYGKSIEVVLWFKCTGKEIHLINGTSFLLELPPVQKLNTVILYLYPFIWSYVIIS